MQQEDYNNDQDSNNVSIAKQLMTDRARPRRLEPDVLNYLRSVKEMLAIQLDDSTSAEDAEDRDLMIWNIVEELSNRTASAMSERSSNEIVELLIKSCSSTQLRYFWQHCQGYYMHLWTNRYSSHLLQKMFARVAPMLLQLEEEENNNDDESITDGETPEESQREVPDISSIIPEMFSELQTEFVRLAQDISGSHVLRALLYVTSGHQPLVEKRGKQAKHREFASSLRNSSLSEVFETPKCINECFHKIVEEFTSLPVPHLQQLVLDQHAGPVISTIVKLLPQQQSLEFIKTVLQWAEAENVPKLVYSLSRDVVGSHFIEAILSTGTTTLDFYSKFIKECFIGSLYDFAKHKVGNFVLQHLLSVSYKILAPSDLEALLAEVSQMFDVLFEMNRPGVVWKAVAASAESKVLQPQVLEAIESAVVKVSDSTFVLKMLQLQLPSAESPRLTMDVSGAHVIQELLKFTLVSQDNVTSILKGIISLGSDALVAMAKDGAAGRIIIEPIWLSKDPSREWVKTELFNSLVGNFVALSVSINGAYTVNKAFENLLDVQSKTRIAQELLAGEHIVAGSHVGRRVLKTCRISEFKTRPDAWKQEVSKVKTVKSMLTDISATKTLKTKSKKKKSKKRATPESSSNLDFVMDALLQSSKKAK